MQPNDALVVFTPQRAAELTGLTRRQVDYWRKTLLLQPSTDEQVSAHRSVRLYDFMDMLAMMTVAEMLRRKVPLQRIRKVVNRAMNLGYDRPLTQISFGVSQQRGKKRKRNADPEAGDTWEERERVVVVMTLADGSTVGDDDMGQAIMPETIDVEAIRAQLRRSTRRDPAKAGRTETRRNTLGSKPVFAGTRIPVDTVKVYLAEGVSDAEILAAFPSLTTEDIRAVRSAS